MKSPERKILAISRCFKTPKLFPNERGHYLYEFHFKGYFSGQEIRLIKAYAKQQWKLEKGQDYVLELTVLQNDFYETETGGLMARIEKAQDLRTLATNDLR